MTRTPLFLLAAWAAITVTLLASLAMDYAFTPKTAKPPARRFWVVFLICFFWPLSLLSGNGREALLSIARGVQS